MTRQETSSDESTVILGRIKDSFDQAWTLLEKSASETHYRPPINFRQFLARVVESPDQVLRNVFQVFHDMVQSYVGDGEDEYPDDPETVHFMRYDCNKLFVDGADQPFFADRLFSNRFLKRVRTLRDGAQQNKIYIFEGPPGCGKSTFLNNLLRRFEEYANSDAGYRWEVVWRLTPELLGWHPDDFREELGGRKMPGDETRRTKEERSQYYTETRRVPVPKNIDDLIIDIPCPSHDSPLLLIPKSHRREFLENLLRGNEFWETLSTEKQYEWVFNDDPCTICSSLFQVLVDRMLSRHHENVDAQEVTDKVYKAIHARRYVFNRRLGDGITVFNPGDREANQPRGNILENKMLQDRLDVYLLDSNLVRYIHSGYAKTNGGIYALMDIKGHNTDRLQGLHNIISEGVHKVGLMEENVQSLFLALMNPEDRSSIEGTQSFLDRIEFIKLNYVLDVKTEVAIYMQTFGEEISASFLPRVLNNFARVIISTRLETRSEAMNDWIGDHEQYSRYCDKNLHLLKMEMFDGVIPKWLSDEHRKGFTQKRRRKLLAESEKEGRKGFSGRDSIRMFNEFRSRFSRKDRLINMAHLVSYFASLKEEEARKVPEGFMESLSRLYDYSVLQEVKESLYYYNEDEIDRDVQNYIFAVNFEAGSTETCTYTKEKLEITEDFFRAIENRILGAEAGDESRVDFRNETQRIYASETLPQQVMAEDLELTQTRLFAYLRERYVHSLKQKVLDPFLENENFRRAIKDLLEDEFRTYDKRIRDDVERLIENLKDHGYQGRAAAREICMYVIDQDLAKKFS